MRGVLAVSVLVVLAFGTGCVKKGRFSPSPEAGAPWPYHRGPISGTGADSAGSFSGKLDIIWQRKQNDKPVGPLTLAGGGLVYPTSRKKIKIFDPATGATLAQIKTRGPAQSGAVLPDSMLYFGVGPLRNEIVGYHVRRGKTLWESPIKDIAGGPILWKNQLITGAGDRRLRSFDLGDGHEIWSVELIGRLIAPPSLSGELVIQPTDAGKLYALTLDSGVVKFETDLGHPLLSAAACGDLIWVADVAGTVHALDTGTGRIVWQKPIGGPIWSALAVTGGRLIAVHSGGEIVALSALTGLELWRYAAVDVIRAAPLCVGEFVVAATMTGKLISLRAESGALVDTLTLTGPVRVAPITDGRRVFVATEAGRITCVGEADATHPTAGNPGALERRP